MMIKNPDIQTILARPYARRLVPDEDGGYVASIQEFPGLIAEGDTADEALGNLEEAAESWLAAAIDLGQSIPEPMDYAGYSGKVALRLPRGLHKQAAEAAQAQEASLNTMLVTAIANFLGARSALQQTVQHLQTIQASKWHTIAIEQANNTASAQFHRTISYSTSPGKYYEESISLLAKPSLTLNLTNNNFGY